MYKKFKNLVSLTIFCLMIWNSICAIPTRAMGVQIIQSGLGTSGYGIVLDSSGNIIVADYTNSKIQKISPDGSTMTELAPGNFSSPRGVGIDKNDNIYVGDKGNNAIEKVSGGIVSTVKTVDMLNTVTVGPNDKIYYAAGNSIYKIDLDGSNAIQLAPSYSFHYPTGLAVDASGNVYVADNNNNKVERINTDGTVTVLAETNGNFKYPYAVAVDINSSNDVYVADYNNLAIKKIDVNQNVTTVLYNAKSTALTMDNRGNLYYFSSGKVCKTQLYQYKTITAVSSISNINFTKGTSIDAVGLPQNVEVTLSDNTTTSAEVTWDGGSPTYNGSVAGTYTFTGTITKPSGINNPNNKQAKVNVIVEEPVVTITAGKGLGRVISGKPQYANAKMPFVIDSQSFLKNLTSYSFNVIYDPEKVGAVTVDTFKGLTKPTVGTPSPVTGSKEKITVSWSGTFTEQDLNAVYNSSNGVLFRLNFVAQQNFTSGETPIEIGTGGICTFESGTSSSITGTNGNVISGIVYGDVNGDGAITSSDTNLINKYVSGKTTAITDEVKKIAADVNGDGSITADDAKEISNYISGKESILKTLFGY